MKLKVLKSFYDKYNGTHYKIDDVIEVNDKRGKELLSNSLELVEVIKPADDEIVQEMKEEKVAVQKPKKRTKKLDS